MNLALAVIYPPMDFAFFNPTNVSTISLQTKDLGFETQTERYCLFGHYVVERSRNLKSSEGGTLDRVGKIRDELRDISSTNWCITKPGL